MKRALLHKLEPGRICEVKNPGEEFEVHENFYWIDVPDDTSTSDTYNEEDGTITKWNPLNQELFLTNGYKVARAIAYGDIGNQLDMLFKEIQATGTISADGPWATHIASVKATIPKDDPAAVLAWNQQFVQNQLGNTSPQ